MNCGGTKELLNGDENVAVESKRSSVVCLVVEYPVEVQYDT